MRLRLLALPALAVAISGAISGASAQSLLKPDAAKVAAVGPDSFDVKFASSKGDFTVRIRRAWAPKGSDRFYYLVNEHFYDEVVFYRVVPGFMAQFGSHADPKVGDAWFNRGLTDEPVKTSNKRGTITFANRGPNTRSTTLFINFGNNAQLDGMGFAPFGSVTSGMAAVDSLYSGYGEGAPAGRGPDQMQIMKRGNAYLKKSFPKLDFIKTARVTQEWKK